MSEIATLAKLEPFYSHPAPSATAAPVSPRGARAQGAPAQGISARAGNGRQGSQLEIFFSEVNYATFVPKKPVAPQAQTPRATSGNSGTLKFNLRLH